MSRRRRIQRVPALTKRDTAVRTSRLQQKWMYILLAAFCLIIYEITSYGGVRSPDSEIMFRTSESLVTRGSFAVEQGSDLQGFGLARGVDGKQYSIFGPAQALFAAPLIAVGHGLGSSSFVREGAFPLPVSHYVDNGLIYFISEQMPPNREAEALRWAAAQLNIIVSALSVVLFFDIALFIGGSSPAALFTALVYGFGTLAWAYSGTFFSEPLTSLFALASFGLLLRNDPSFGTGSPSLMRTVLAGASLGIATAAHITAILFAPFFLVYALYPYWHLQKKTSDAFIRALFLNRPRCGPRLARLLQLLPVWESS